MMAAYLLGKGAAPQLTGNNKPRPVDPDPGGSVSFSMDPDLTLHDKKVKATFTLSLRNSVTTVVREIKAKSFRKVGSITKSVRIRNAATNYPPKILFI